jgi:hypothetical protein
LEARALSTLVIYITKISLEQSVCLLETLAWQSDSRAAQFAQTLKIKCLKPSFQPHESASNQKERKSSISRKRDGLKAARATLTMKRRLGQAISSLHNLKSVV